MDMDTFTFVDIDCKDEDMKDTSLEELKGSLPLFSPLRFTQSGKRQHPTDPDTPLSRQPKKYNSFHKSLSFGDHPAPQPTAAISRLMDVDNVIGDGTGAFCLPTVQGKHRDLKSINSSTLVALLNGFYDDVISGFQIIDCRYPYEYNGGHIQGAENLHTQSSIEQFLLDNQNKKQTDVLIFHCEFSSERAPKLCRYLRNKDREINSVNYPFLTFPEVYILDGGYKSFYYSHKVYCEPMNYIPMLHQDHTADIRHFRSKSKSWTAGEKRKSPQRLLF